mgnify:CR=1 FL=1
MNVLLVVAPQQEAVTVTTTLDDPGMASVGIAKFLVVEPARIVVVAGVFAYAESSVRLNGNPPKGAVEEVETVPVTTTPPGVEMGVKVSPYVDWYQRIVRRSPVGEPHV